MEACEFLFGQRFIAIAFLWFCHHCSWVVPPHPKAFEQPLYHLVFSRHVSTFISSLRRACSLFGVPGSD